MKSDWASQITHRNYYVGWLDSEYPVSWDLPYDWWETGFALDVNCEGTDRLFETLDAHVTSET
jgi:hypothetical protein